MNMTQNRVAQGLALLMVLIALSSCSEVAEWPDSPLYTFEQTETSLPIDLETAKKEIVGHYAHYDVVAYEDTTTRSACLGSMNVSPRV